MNILQVLLQLRDNIKAWVTNNLKALNDKIDEKTIPIDSELDITSINPVQNKIITSELNDINERVGNTSVAQQIATLTKITTTENGGLKITNNTTVDIDEDVVFILDGGSSTEW